MSAELIHVDFKKREVIKSEKTRPKWNATKDENFKSFVEAFAQCCEWVDEQGGDWKRAVIIVSDKIDGEDVCYTLWDNKTIQDKDVLDIQSVSSHKVFESMTAAALEKEVTDE